MAQGCKSLLPSFAKYTIWFARRSERLLLAKHFLACVFVISCCLLAGAQTNEQTASNSSISSTLNDSSNTLDVRKILSNKVFVAKFNAGLAFYQVHDSAIGWYNVVTPAVSYNFSNHVYGDASLSIYPRRPVPVVSDVPPFTEEFEVKRGDLGDMMLSLHAQFYPRFAAHTITASLMLPTGNRDDGLGTGKVTFDFSEHIEKYFGQTGFLVEVGMGNSAGLVNSVVAKDYSSLGPLSHFEVGALHWFMGSNYIQSYAYEQLPIGGQTVFTISGPPGVPDMRIVTGNGINEDNGFTTSMGIPLTSHITLSGYYNRSLRRDLDTSAVGLIFVLKGMKVKPRMSMEDKALREAESFDQ
jgi:hypothetical protein